MRSIAQNRLTAVGRVAAISSHTFWNSAANFCVPVALLLRMPIAMPIAAATPIAGAPRITIVLMARATSAAVLHRTYTSCDGSLRWSIITTTSSSRAMVGSMKLDSIGSWNEPGTWNAELGTSSEQPCIKRQRQKRLQPVCGLLSCEVRQNDFEVAAEFPQDLPARAARRRQRRRVGDDGDAGKNAMAFGDRLEHRDAFGADRQAVRRVFDVAARNNCPVGGFEGSAHFEV